jgi:hypothetical protein
VQHADPTVPITTTTLPENTPTLLTIPMVMIRTTTSPQLGIGLLPKQQQAYQEEQQVWIRAQQIDAEQRAAQRHDELASERAALDAQLTKLHYHKVVLKTERATTINFTKARAQARAIAATINREGPPHLTFTTASQNMAIAAAILDTLLVPSTDGVDKVYRHLKNILSVDVVQ